MIEGSFRLGQKCKIILDSKFNQQLGRFQSKDTIKFTTTVLSVKEKCVLLT